ncbi:MAG: DEAD/DEAH box helicase family protein [Nitrosomonadales bacterium]|nr:DEAD/DEAH box helicase family protein [Nitrosomonadales bacterium]
MPSATPARPGRGRARPANLPDQPLDRFSDSLVLNAWMIAQFGFDALPANSDDGKPIRALARSVMPSNEGLGADGLHHYYHAFKAVLPAQAAVKPDVLLRYEENIVAHTARLNAGRSRKIVWKYFQWLTLLCVERYLDRFFQDRYGLLDELNAFVAKFNKWRTDNGYAGQIAPFSLQELNKVCLQNATGSGKTLLMHANLLQFRHHAKAANKLADYSRALLLTPGEDLTAQHLRELEESGIRAQRFVADLLAQASAELSTVDALEIHKLAEKDGEKTIALRNFGDANLLLVDEGHVGLASNEETGFMARRDALSGKGFVFEYSATFAQAVKAAGNEAVTQAYAKSVLFDYSYRYFYADGYGKDYQVFNLADSRFDAGHTERLYLTAGLLSFYQQLRVYDEQRAALAEFNLEKPLWVFVGASVTRAIGGNLEERDTATDVRNIVQFIADFLHDWQQSEADIQHVLNGAVQDGNGQNLFEHTFHYLQDKRREGETATKLHQDVLARLFGGGGILRLTRVSGDTAEIRLHTGEAGKPFGLINVGDAPGLMRELEKCLSVQAEESQFATGALFGLM